MVTISNGPPSLSTGDFKMVECRRFVHIGDTDQRVSDSDRPTPPRALAVKATDVTISPIYALTAYNEPTSGSLTQIKLPTSQTEEIQPIRTVSIRPVTLIKGVEVTTQGSGKPCTSRGPTRGVLPVHDLSDIGRTVVDNNVQSVADESPRSGTFPLAVRKVRRTRVQVLPDELAAVAAISAYPSEQLSGSSQRNLPNYRLGSLGNRIAAITMVGLLGSFSIAAYFWTMRENTDTLPTPIAVYFWATRENADTLPIKSAQQPPSSLPQEATPANASVTEIVTNPPGAEVAFQGTVSSNRPMNVERSQYQQLYLLSKAGFESKVLRISPASEIAIRTKLQPSNIKNPDNF